MKFKKTNNNPQKLAEAFRVISGKDAEKAADIIDSIIEYRDRFDLSDEEVSSLEVAYNILFNCAPYVQESLKEAKDINLSDKSNSISGLLLDNKDKIDAAASQQELVKVCKDALAEKGGSKAQQFLAVLASKKGHYAALKYVYDFILAGEGMRSADSKRKTNPAHMKESLDEEFSTEQDLINAGFERVMGRKGYDFYRKLIDGRGRWYAAKDGQVIPITYEQARGYEPINSEEKMAMTLGRKLMPKS